MRTVEEIREELDDVIAAMRAIARGAQSYQIGSRSGNQGRPCAAPSVAQRS